MCVLCVSMKMHMCTYYYTCTNGDRCCTIEYRVPPGVQLGLCADLDSSIVARIEEPTGRVVFTHFYSQLDNCM